MDFPIASRRYNFPLGRFKGALLSQQHHPPKPMVQSINAQITHKAATAWWGRSSERCAFTASSSKYCTSCVRASDCSICEFIISTKTAEIWDRPADAHRAVGNSRPTRSFRRSLRSIIFFKEITRQLFQVYSLNIYLWAQEIINEKFIKFVWINLMNDWNILFSFFFTNLFVKSGHSHDDFFAWKRVKKNRKILQFSTIRKKDKKYLQKIHLPQIAAYFFME